MSFPLTTNNALIADGTSISGSVFVGYGLLVGLIVPSGWDSADITLQACPVEGGTFYNVHNKAGDTEETIQAGASRHIWLDPPMRGFGWIKVRSGTSGSPVNQSGDVIVGVVTEKNPIY